MEIGISQLVAPNLPMDEFLGKAKEGGYEAVELSMRPKGPITGETTAAELRAFGATARTLGLQVVSMTINHCTGNLLAGGDAARTSIAETIAGLEAAACLGAPVALHT